MLMDAEGDPDMLSDEVGGGSTGCKGCMPNTHCLPCLQEAGGEDNESTVLLGSEDSEESEGEDSHAPEAVMHKVGHCCQCAARSQVGPRLMHTHARTMYTITTALVEAAAVQV
jgi:hypothetical protein